MKCYVCRSVMIRIQTDLPFKVSETAIVLVKALPVLQCERCPEFALEDRVMEQVDAILRQADARTELEIVRFTA